MAQNIWCGVFAKVTDIYSKSKNERVGFRVEMYMLSDVHKYSSKNKYDQLLEKFGGRYNKKTDTATVNATSLMELRQFIEYELMGVNQYGDSEHLNGVVYYDVEHYTEVK